MSNKEWVRIGDFGIRTNDLTERKKQSMGLTKLYKLWIKVKYHYHKLTKPTFTLPFPAQYPYGQLVTYGLIEYMSIGNGRFIFVRAIPVTDDFPPNGDIVLGTSKVGIPAIMKRLNFVQDSNGNSYTRGFTRIYTRDNSLAIGHTITNRTTPIEYIHLNEWIKYFDRI